MKFKTKRIFKRVFSAGLAVIIGVGLIAGASALFTKFDEDTKSISPSYSVGGLTNQGSYEETENSIYTKDAFEWIDYYRGETGANWSDFYTPEVNIDYGVWLLSYHYGLFGDWETVYAAYNAGPNAVKKWLENPEYSLDGKTLDKIPYEETSNYCEKVSKYREDYQRIYGFD